MGTKLIALTGIKDGATIYVNSEEFLVVQPGYDDDGVVIGSRIIFRTDTVTANVKEDPEEVFVRAAEA